jgi:TonB family protein
LPNDNSGDDEKRAGPQPPTEEETTVPGAEAKPESEQSADQQELNEESGDPELGTQEEAFVPASIVGLDRTIERSPSPRYTENVDTQVLVKITVNPEGRIVRRILLNNSSPKFEAAVMNALQRWRFNDLPSGAPQENQTAIIGFDFGAEAGSGGSNIPDSLIREFETELYGNMLSNCRILFATTPSRSPDDLSRSDSIALLNGEVADELRSKDLRVVVRRAPTENGAMYGLFSKRTGTLEDMEKRKKELTDIVDAGPVLCMP